MDKLIHGSIESKNEEEARDIEELRKILKPTKTQNDAQLSLL